MKKLLSLVAVAVALSGVISAQNIILTSPHSNTNGLISPNLNTVINNDTITYCTDDFLATFEDGKILVINNTGSAMGIKVKRFANENSCFASNQFCWTICYNPAVSASPDSISIGANDSTEAFHGWMGPDGSEGCCFIKYRFYNAADTNDYAETTIKYCFSNDCAAVNLGIEDQIISGFGLYPNPATESFNISLYPSDRAEMIKITDQAGRVVKELNVQPNTTLVPVDRDGLSSGVYFCQLYLDGKLVTTRKLSLR